MPQEGRIKFVIRVFEGGKAKRSLMFQILQKKNHIFRSHKTKQNFARH